jgi:hypothetical protein
MMPDKQFMLSSSQVVVSSRRSWGPESRPGPRMPQGQRRSLQDTVLPAQPGSRHVSHVRRPRWSKVTRVVVVAGSGRHGLPVEGGKRRVRRPERWEDRLASVLVVLADGREGSRGRCSCRRRGLVVAQPVQDRALPRGCRERGQGANLSFLAAAGHRARGCSGGTEGSGEGDEATRGLELHKATVTEARRAVGVQLATLHCGEHY